MGTLASSTNYFSNAIVGQPGVGADIDLYASSSTPKYQVGFGFTRGDGNKYRYAQFGAIANRGNLVAPLTSDGYINNTIKAGALVANLTKQGNETMNPNAIGSRYAQLTVSASAHQFEGGYLVVHSGTGFGFTYRIKDNDTTSTKVTGDTFLNLYEPIVVALDSNSEIAIALSPYVALTPATSLSATAANVSGVTVTNNSAGSYGWVCTHGVTSALSDVSIGLAGKAAYVSTNTAGCVSALSGTLGSAGALSTAYVGIFLVPGTSANYATIYCTLE